MFKDYKYSVFFSKTYITSSFSFLLHSTSNVRMSEGTFCRVEVHISLYVIYIPIKQGQKHHSMSAPRQNTGV